MARCAVRAAAVLWASSCAGCASARRVVADDADVATGDREAGPQDTKLDLVDFGFMTNDMSYVKHEKDLAGQASEWMFGTRGSSDDGKHDIVRGHFCQSRGRRAETYYASAYCYWLPDVEAPGAPRGGDTMHWEGGPAHFGSVLLARESGAGACVKAMVCHDNARNEDASPRRTTFREQLDLPKGCLLESQIRERCTGQYEESAGTLPQEGEACLAARAKSEEAARLLSQCDERLERLPRLIAEEYPGMIAAQEEAIRDRERRLSDQQIRLQLAARSASSACSGRVPASDPYLRCLRGPSSLLQFPAGAAAGAIHGARRARCRRCQEAWRSHDRVKRHVALAEKHVGHARSQARELETKRERAVLELQQLKDQRPDLVEQNDVAAGEWSSRSEGCNVTFQKYRDGLKTHLASCAPSMYNASCERACLEQAAPRSGCAVVEGDAPGSPNGRGGIAVPCAPPKPSWIQSFGEGETSDGQCDRIQSWQRLQYAQRTLKTGWMYLHRHGINSWTPGYQWDKFFFVLEGSDQVRSAVLRYYESDPLHPSTAERVNCSVILWDANSLKEKEYDCPDGDDAAGFKIHHFYRDYRFCVLASYSQTAGQARSDWMDLIRKEMRFPGVV